MFSSSGRLKMGSLFARLSRLRDSWLLGSASHATAGSSPDDKVQTTCNARLGSVKKCTCFTIGNKSKAFMVFYSIYKSTVFKSPIVECAEQICCRRVLRTRSKLRQLVEVELYLAMS
jgi:hypothetical protein